MKRKNIQELSNSNEVSNNVKRLKKTDQHEEEKDGYVENEEFEYEYDSKEEEEDEEEEEGDEGSGNWNFVGPLSIQNEKKQWILHKFGIDTSLKILKSLTVKKL